MSSELVIWDGETLRCLYCGEEIAVKDDCYEPFDLPWQQALKYHLDDAHQVNRNLALRCVCGVCIKSDVKRDALHTSVLLILDHLQHLTPAEAGRHFVLYQLGLRLEEVS